MLSAKKAWRKKNKKKQKLINRQQRLKRYGLVLEDYDRMLEAQGGRCAICGLSNRVLGIDHCHKTNKVRAILCINCNAALGGFMDSPQLLRSAADYLESFV